jgi:hypothetical protein
MEAPGPHCYATVGSKNFQFHYSKNESHKHGWAYKVSSPILEHEDPLKIAFTGIL